MPENTTQTDTDDERSFRNKQMENAYYWAAQAARWFTDGPNAGLEGTYYVEVRAGKPTIVLDDTWDQSRVDAAIDGLIDANFPTSIKTRELEDEWRIFISEPTRDRLVSYYEDDWREFENQTGFEETKKYLPEL